MCPDRQNMTDLLSVPAVVAETLSLAAFYHLAGELAGYPFIKVVWDKETGKVHFINNAHYKMHAHYVGEQLLGVTRQAIEKDIDSFNRSVYLDPNRRFYLGVLALHRREERSFFSLETVEIDAMTGGMMQDFYGKVREHVDASLALFFKPANHWQEASVAKIDALHLPRVLAHEIFATAHFIALNPGTAKGRLRFFTSEDEYRAERSTLLWHDIIVMRRVPDDIPRISGIINGSHTTPLSHTNVLASGWQIPNAIQIGIEKRIAAEELNNAWVEYAVQANAAEVVLKKIEKPFQEGCRPSWSLNVIKLEKPETGHVPIVALERLRAQDSFRYGTKAANLGEMHYVLREGGRRLTGFYAVRRPPRPNLLSYLATFLKVPESSDLNKAAWQFLKDNIQIPRGIALPFSLQQRFLESSPQIQQALGKLKMALELNARQIDSLCVSLQQMIRQTRISDDIRNYIDAEIAHHLGGTSSFVVRSSSNAEDLKQFSAAGIYESINHVSTAENIFDSIKQVWASLLSLRSVRLRHEAGISLDDSYMGVIIQEEVSAQLGGVLVTTNPLNRADFRNVYFNIAPQSVADVVQGVAEPLQYYYNTVEGGGRTLSLGGAQTDLSAEHKERLQRLAFAGRLLQSHFSPDYTYSTPVDIEWVLSDDNISILQLRPFAQ